MKSISASIIVLAGAVLWHGMTGVSRDMLPPLAIGGFILLLFGFIAWITDKGLSQK